MGRYDFDLKPGECKVVAGRRFCNRWKRNTAESTPDYVRGVKKPRRPWDKATIEAKNIYKAGVDAAYTKGLFVKGTKKAGTKKWRDKTLERGPTRFAQGVSEGGNDYRNGFVPYWRAIKKMTLPVRYPGRDPRNMARCAAVCKTLIWTKVHL